MLAFIIKILSMNFCCIYFYTKISYNPISFKFNKFNFSLLLFIMTFIAIVLYYFNSEFTYFAPFVLLWIFASLLSYEPQKSFILTTISFAISMWSYGITSFICTLIMHIFFISQETFPFTLLATLSSCLHITCIYLLCKTKRFRKGMPFLSSYSTLNIVTFICIFISILSFYVVGNHSKPLFQILCFFAFFFSFTFLIYWWQAQITKSYRQSLVERELESLRTELSEKDALLEKKDKDIQRLSTISHRHISLIMAMKNSTTTYLKTSFATEEERIQTGEKLAANIELLSEGYTGSSEDGTVKVGKTFDTGVSLLDELLGYISTEAAKQNILFSVHSSIELSDFIPMDISENELVHMIDDLLKNAFKATRNSERRMVQLQFYKLGKHFVVEVADNGIPFEIRSLVNMGIEKLTTYEDGSGIGLMDIWNTKENLRATYHLEEYVSPSPFSKRISLTFDKKNRYSIRTYRKDEIQKQSKRIDLQIYEKEK